MLADAALSSKWNKSETEDNTGVGDITIPVAALLDRTDAEKIRKFIEEELSHGVLFFI